jgi:hypothetical protein
VLKRHEMPPIPAGALARLVSAHAGVEVVTLGPVPDREEGDDPQVPVGTVCMVCREHDDKNITSAPAYIILVEIEGRAQQCWVYRDELEVL